MTSTGTLGGSRKPLISGNWKMNHNHFEAIGVVQKLSYRLLEADCSRTEVAVHPPFTDLRSVQTILDADDLPISLGAQNCHWEDSGPYTGEVSPAMLVKLDVRYVIVGHSERRQLFYETDEIVAQKLRAVLRHSMTPILCVGESLEERDTGTTEHRVVGQLNAALEGLRPEEVRRCVLAYEPVWAIGTGRTASPADAQEVCSVLRQTVAAGWGAPASCSLRIQYGGSVTTDNASELLAQPDIDGALVGGASLDPDTFAMIVRSAPA